MKNWDKILDDFARKCKGGAPDMTNPRHLALLRESLLKFGWNENATNEFLGNLREGEDSVYDKKVLNPDTGRKVKVSTALGYDKKKSVYQAALAMVQDDPAEEKEVFKKVGLQVIPTSKTLPAGKEDKVQGNPGPGNDNEVKNDMLEHGFNGYKEYAEKSGIMGKDGKPKKPAPGSPGSAFNEIVTGQGIEILENHPNLSEKELALRNFNQFGRTSLGSEQSLTSEIEDSAYPSPIIENISSAKKDQYNFVRTSLGFDKDFVYDPSTYKSEEGKAFKAKRDALEKDAIKSKPKTPEGKAYKELMQTALKAETQKAIMSKCLVSARSARTKFGTSQERTKKLQQTNGSDGKPLMGKETKNESFYGADDSLDAQLTAIDNAERVLLPNGQVLNKQHIKDFVSAGGAGANPSDTATFVSDEEGNLMVQFHSDKTSTADIQDNSTLKKEENNYRKQIDKYFKKGSPEHKAANDIMNSYMKKIDADEEKYNDAGKPVAVKLNQVPLSDQVNLIKQAKRVNDIKDKTQQKNDPHYDAKTRTLFNNLDKAVMSSDGKGILPRYKNFIPKGKKPEHLTIEDKYKMLRSLVASGNGEANDTKVIVKIGQRLSKDRNDPMLNSDHNISTIRETVVNAQRARVDELNKITAPNGKPLGTMMEADETIRGFHLTLMDANKYDPTSTSEEDKNKRFKGIMNSSFDVLMGGSRVTGDTLKNCMSVNNTDDFKNEFTLDEEESYTYAQDGVSITGKTVFRYALDKKGRKFPIGFKKYRPKSGKLGKTNNTFNYSDEMQGCFKTGKAPIGKK